MLLTVAQAAADSTAPWWGTPTYTLAGIIAGGVIGHFTARLQTKQQREHSRAAANEEYARQACVDFNTALNGTMTRIGQGLTTELMGPNYWTTYSAVELWCPPELSSAIRRFSVDVFGYIVNEDDRGAAKERVYRSNQRVLAGMRAAFGLATPPEAPKPEGP